MEIKKVTDPEFRKYGKVVENIDFSGLIRVLQEKTPLPADVVYEPSAEVLEAEPVFETVQEKTYDVSRREVNAFASAPVRENFSNVSSPSGFSNILCSRKCATPSGT